MLLKDIKSGEQFTLGKDDIGFLHKQVYRKYNNKFRCKGMIATDNALHRVTFWLSGNTSVYKKVIK